MSSFRARKPVAEKPPYRPQVSGGYSEASLVVRNEENITVGRFKVWRRSDGAWIAYDESRPGGDRTVVVASSADDVIRKTKEILRAEVRDGDTKV